MVNNHEEHLDTIFHALSDRTRRAMLARLSGAECNVTELAEPFQMSLAAVSKHLKVLEEAGLVEKLKEGRTYRCRASLEPLQDVEKLFEQLAGFWNSRLDALETFLRLNETNEGNDDVKRTSAEHTETGTKKDNKSKKRKGV